MAKKLIISSKFPRIYGSVLILCVFAGCLSLNTKSENEVNYSRNTNQNVNDRYQIKPKDVATQQFPPKLTFTDHNLPSLTGTEFIEILQDLPLDERENKIFEYIVSGSVPDFLHNLVEIVVKKDIQGQNSTLQYFVTPDYLSLGTNEDYFMIPMTPGLAQRICNKLNCVLPTKLMVDQIWDDAPLKLEPTPIPPSEQMTSILVMAEHNKMVHDQRKPKIQSYPLGTLTVGHKKDVVISNQIYVHEPSRRVVIYGWHYLTGKPIQPVYAGHGSNYADYSHGIRAVHAIGWLNNEPIAISEILKDPNLHVLISDEGVIQSPNYPF